MEKKAKVLLREKNQEKFVKITNPSMPNISNVIMGKWQRIINIMAKIMNIPAGLIMQITKDSLVVFLKSQNEENPYREGGSDKLGNGLYCETVIGTDQDLLVKNALNDIYWRDNPDTKLNMISYYGLPIHWPNKEFFGTICVLDNKENNYSDEYKALLKEFRDAIETDLKTLMYERKLKFFADMDILTSSYNRNKIEKILKKQFSLSLEDNSIFSVVIMDINQLKKINDENGHMLGDKVIKTFANSFKSVISKDCSFGRWGGDEFVLICPNVNSIELEQKLAEVFPIVTDNMRKIIDYASYCYGCAQFNPNEENYHKLLTRADSDLYKWKNRLKESGLKNSNNDKVLSS